MNKEIAIIGVNGKMGKWFADYFHKIGFKVKGFDTNNEIKEKFIIKANSLVGAILQMDYVLLCTPTKNTPEIIRLIAKEMKRGSYLIEISSQKFCISLIQFIFKDEGQTINILSALHSNAPTIA